MLILTPIDVQNLLNAVLSFDKVWIINITHPQIFTGPPLPLHTIWKTLVPFIKEFVFMKTILIILAFPVVKSTEL